MTKRTEFSTMWCSAARTLDIIGEWWTPLILRDLSLGICRFSGLLENLGISRKILSNRLETLLQHDIVEKRAYQSSPPRYEYQLTERGRDLVPIILAITAWGDKWISPGGKPLIFRHKDCGRDAYAKVVCSECLEPMGSDSFSARPGPGMTREERIDWKRTAERLASNPTTD